MKPLTEADIIEIFREEWDHRVRALSEEIDVVLSAPTVGGDSKIILAPELKVRHKESGIRYTVDSVSPREVVLRTPENETFLVDAQELEAYELD